MARKMAANHHPKITPRFTTFLAATPSITSHVGPGDSEGGHKTSKFDTFFAVNTGFACWLVAVNVKKKKR